jgi:hypothetical protein
VLQQLEEQVELVSREVDLVMLTEVEQSVECESLRLIELNHSPCLLLKPHDEDAVHRALLENLAESLYTNPLVLLTFLLRTPNELRVSPANECLTNLSAQLTVLPKMNHKPDHYLLNLPKLHNHLLELTHLLPHSEILLDSHCQTRSIVQIYDAHLLLLEH